MKEKLYNLYYPYKKIRNVIVALQGEISKPKSVLKGEIFEDYIRKYLFPKSRYKLEHRTHSFKIDDFCNSSLEPDFIFTCIESGKKIGVEAKYRAKYSSDFGVEICKEFQLRRYRESGRLHNMDVFIALGLEGHPSSCQNIYLIPLNKITSNKLKKEDIHHFRVSLKEIVATNYLKIFQS
jgi:hypothetical protein